MNYIETDCTIQHAGKSFEAGGAVVTDNYIIAYPGDNGQLRDWHGKVIGKYRVTSSWPAIFFGCQSWQGERMFAMRATVDGREYSLRGFGKGMVARGRAVKTRKGN